MIGTLLTPERLDEAYEIDMLWRTMVGPVIEKALPSVEEGRTSDGRKIFGWTERTLIVLMAGAIGFLWYHGNELQRHTLQLEQLVVQHMNPSGLGHETRDQIESRVAEQQKWKDDFHSVQRGVARLEAIHQRTDPEAARAAARAVPEPPPREE